MALVMWKHMEIWYDKPQKVVEIIDYISAVQKVRDAEEHDIQVLWDNNIDRIRKSAKYWVNMAQEPQWEIQKKWDENEKGWEKIN